MPAHKSRSGNSILNVINYKRNYIIIEYLGDLRNHGGDGLLTIHIIDDKIVPEVTEDLAVSAIIETLTLLHICIHKYSVMFIYVTKLFSLSYLKNASSYKLTS